MSRWYYYASAYFILGEIDALGIIDRIFYYQWLGKPGDKITETLYLTSIATILALFARGFRRFQMVKTSAYWAFALVGLFLFSSVWSTEPATTIHQAINYWLMLLGAIGIATNLECDEYMHLLAVMCFLAGLASLALWVADPSLVFTEDGDFRGIFSQKNILGMAMSIGALASLHGLRVNRRRRLWNVVFLVVVTLAAIRSESMTSCVIIFIFCIVDLTRTLMRKGGVARTAGIVVLVVAIPMIVYAAAAPDTVMVMMGKDPTLTGRTEIWAYVMVAIYQKPLLGWGYLAFWSFHNPAAMEISNALNWFVPESHNGLLEILLYLGVIGAAFFIVLWGRTVRLALRCLRTSQKAAAISCLLSCIGVIVVGISETVLIVPSEASTSVFFITGFMCEKALRLARVRRIQTVRRNSPRRGNPVRARTGPNAMGEAKDASGVGSLV